MPETLFDRLGGAPAIDAAVELFYTKVLADPELSPFFAEIDMVRQRKMQKDFLTMAFGGPNNYKGRDMRKAHMRPLKAGMNDTHFDLVVQHLGASLNELGVNDELITEVATAAESLRDDVLNR